MWTMIVLMIIQYFLAKSRGMKDKDALLMAAAAGVTYYAGYANAKGNWDPTENGFFGDGGDGVDPTPQMQQQIQQPNQPQDVDPTNSNAPDANDNPNKKDSEFDIQYGKTYDLDGNEVKDGQNHLPKQPIVKKDVSKPSTNTHVVDAIKDGVNHGLDVANDVFHRGADSFDNAVNNTPGGLGGLLLMQEIKQAFKKHPVAIIGGILLTLYILKS